ncbi:MAG: glycosyltransferase, partial [Elusimicrobiota bacterium]
RLTAAKAHWRLLRIFAEVKKTVPEAALVFLGEGELKRGLLCQCEDLDLAAHDAGGGSAPGAEDVFFAGFQANPFKFLARARLFTFTSLWEGLPNAVIEALACGLPVISADCRSGPRELLAPGTDPLAAAAAPEATATGLLMPPFPASPPEFGTDSDAQEKLWAEKIKELLSDEARLARLGGAARERAAAFAPGAKKAEWLEALGTDS